MSMTPKVRWTVRWLTQCLGFTPRITDRWTSNPLLEPEALEPGIRSTVLRMSNTGLLTPMCSCEGHMGVDWSPDWRYPLSSLIPMPQADSPVVIFTTSAELSIRIRMAIFAARNRGELKSRWQLRSYVTDSPNGWDGNGITPPIQGIYHLLGIWPDGLLWVRRSRWAKELDLIAELIEKECLAFRSHAVPQDEPAVSTDQAKQDS